MMIFGVVDVFLVDVVVIVVVIPCVVDVVVVTVVMIFLSSRVWFVVVGSLLKVADKVG